MVTASKRARGNEGKVDDASVYSLAEGITALKKTSGTKFDESVDIAVNLGIDPKKSDQSVRGAVALPHGTGYSRTVIAFVKDPEKQAAAKEAGAVEVGSDDLVKKVQDGWADFDVAVAAPDMMGMVGKLGKVLGPQGKMPTPKAGTVHAPVGKRSFDDAKLAENVKAFLDALVALKPSSAKGTYIKKTFLTTTMGPSVQVDTAS